MTDAINFPLILGAALVASLSPGPASLAVAGTSMASGRLSGLVLASGITTGSLMWSVSAAFGLGAIMLANAWVFELIRYFGVAYLLFLAYKSAKSAMTPGTLEVRKVEVQSLQRVYFKGIALHLTNPKTILFFGSLYAIGVPHSASPLALATVTAAIGLQTFLVFHGYALLFSSNTMTRKYIQLRRWFESLFAFAFGAASIKILTTTVE